MLLTESMVEFFVQHNIMVLLSIDGRETTHDRFRVDRGGRGNL